MCVGGLTFVATILQEARSIYILLFHTAHTRRYWNSVNTLQSPVGFNIPNFAVAARHSARKMMPQDRFKQWVSACRQFSEEVEARGTAPWSLESLRAWEASVRSTHHTAFNGHLCWTASPAIELAVSLADEHAARADTVPE